MPKRPNILFSMSDDQRYDCMGCAGHPFIDTPAMNRLAEEGVRFVNGFTAVPLCAPARATCLTGVYPHIHGVAHNKRGLNTGMMTWPQMLQQAGYRTGFIGKIHYGGTGNPQPGFDRWVSFPGQGSYFNPTFNVDGDRVAREGYHTDLLSEYALEFLDNADNRPWALCLWYKAPHAPFTPPERYAQSYADTQLKRPTTINAPRKGKAQCVQTGEGPGCAGDWYPDGIFQAGKTWEQFTRDYVRTVRAVDDALGRVLDKLDEMGETENTFVIHTSDHGFFHGEFGLGNKRWLYEPSIRIPYLVRYPVWTKQAIRAEEALVLNLDLPATIVDAVGLSIPHHYQGNNLRPLLTNKGNWTREAVFIEYFYDAPFVAYPSMYCLRTTTQKLIHYLTEGDTDEFYDLVADAGETQNRIHDPAYTAPIVRMREQLEAEKVHHRYVVPDLTMAYTTYQPI